MTDVDILAVGRVSVDLYAEQFGPLAGVRSYRSAVGGTATNLAVAAAKLGHHPALLTRVGAEGFGDVVRQWLRGYGVDTRFVGTDDTLHTPLAFAELDPPEDPGLIFYREPQAPDMRITTADVDEELVRSAPILWVTGSRFSAEPSAGTVRTMLGWRERRRHTVLDLDYRPSFWSSADDARKAISAVLDQVTIAVGNRTECGVAVGSEDPHQAAERLLDHGLELAIVKMGGGGVLVAPRDEQPVEVPPVPVEVVCGLGAGDAFGGALCHGLLNGWDHARTVAYANIAGAIVAGRLLCSEAMPTADEVQAVLDGGDIAAVIARGDRGHRDVDDDVGEEDNA